MKPNPKRNVEYFQSYSFHLSLRTGSTASASPASAVVSVGGGEGGGDGGLSARVTAAVAIRTTRATAAAGDRCMARLPRRSVAVEVALNRFGPRGLQERELEQGARLPRIELHRGDGPELIVVELDVAADDAGVRTRR